MFTITPPLGLKINFFKITSMTGLVFWKFLWGLSFRKKNYFNWGGLERMGKHYFGSNAPWNQRHCVRRCYSQHERPSAQFCSVRADWEVCDFYVCSGNDLRLSWPSRKNAFETSWSWDLKKKKVVCDRPLNIFPATISSRQFLSSSFFRNECFYRRSRAVLETVLSLLWSILSGLISGVRS